MKKIKLIGVLLGIFGVFGSILTVNAKTKNVEKSVSGQHDSFFEDGTMDRSYYKKLPNIYNLGKGNGVKFKYANKTGAKHLVYIYAAYRWAFNKVLKESNINLSIEEKDNILRFIKGCCINPDVCMMLGHVGVVGNQYFNVDGKIYNKVLKKMFAIMGKFEITESIYKKLKGEIIDIVDDELEERNGSKEEILKKGKESKRYFERYNNILMKIKQEVKNTKFEEVKRVGRAFICEKGLRESKEGKVLRTKRVGG